MSAVQLSVSDFDQQVLKADKPVLVDFYAQWCGPCHMAAPIIDKLASEYQDKVIFGKVDVDADSALAQKYGVMSIPTMIMFKGGQEIDRKVGFPGEQGLREFVRQTSQ